MFPTVQHYITWRLALGLDDEVVARVRQTDSPAVAAALEPALTEVEDELRLSVATEGYAARFRSDRASREFLESTDGLTLAFAATDQVWGIGVTARDHRARDPRRWPGSNLCGIALMRVRADLLLFG